jgi:hypothetical protein
MRAAKYVYVRQATPEVLDSPGPFLDRELVQVRVSGLSDPSQFERAPRAIDLARTIAGNPSGSPERMCAEVAMYIVSEPDLPGSAYE